MTAAKTVPKTEYKVKFGRLYGWGANSHDNLALGRGAHKEEVLTPREINLTHINLDPIDIEKIVGGGGHTLMIDKAGKVYSCGWNVRGQAGTTEQTYVIVKVSGLDDLKIVDVACGWDCSMALTDDGLVYAWGSNLYGQLGGLLPIGVKTNKPKHLQLDRPVKKISLGLRHSAIVTCDNKVLTSGAGNKGQLGRDLQDATNSNEFVEVPGLDNVSSVSCGQYHTVICTNDNKVFAWGDNRYGQLGVDISKFKQTTKPMEVEGLKNFGICKEVYCAWTHSAIMNSENKVYLWGRNAYGQLGLTNMTPICTDTWTAKQVEIPHKIKEFCIGSQHNLMLCDNNQVFSWGWNEHGSCGVGHIDDIYEPTAVPIPHSHEEILHIGTGAAHCFAIVKKDESD
ncbi:ultraviolet-B receptor UVR8 [Trichogramma pretiosum]|uniref:ultraviolet-B receptor UVR8 n=1 Tax=Trichogramma pretiosum TaxID=7493 RepID=UPI0006C97DC7|nr:ultraviolet-B receptor UVR8 [Trichogramma pretiosum]